MDGDRMDAGGHGRDETRQAAAPAPQPAPRALLAQCRPRPISRWFGTYTTEDRACVGVSRPWRGRQSGRGGV